MSRLQNIENALMDINDAVFQELCDCFLFRKNDNYKLFSRTGSQAGKQKTIKGTPDSFLLLPNDNYLFLEYSTNATKGLSKLKEDIKKCLDVDKTSIHIDKIKEIIFCVNFRLNTKDKNELNELLIETRIDLTIYTLDSLALELHLYHRDLAHLYLKLPLDTGQIVSIETFINEYNKASKRIATPLDNSFLHRDNELNELKDMLNQNDIVIIYGSPGVGKTKLALETINSFLKDNIHFNAFCISYKNTALIDDLPQYFKFENNYILFVDDANRIDAFSQILGFYKNQRAGKLKILITVRDYALQALKSICMDFQFSLYTLSKFTDEQIIEIIKEKPFEILNSLYYKKIIQIADGNPRIAIMAALLAKQKQDIRALLDVSDLFEVYFSTFINDEGAFSNVNNIKILGIIAFFYAIPFRDRELTNTILENFKLDYNEFIENIDKLDKLEIVDIQYDYVKIPEQNTSTYFFYKAFIKDNLLQFNILIDKYFENNISRFKDCVIPANNTFGYHNVMEKLHPHLLTYWESIKSRDEKAIRFLSVFWFYLQNETLEYFYNKIIPLPENKCTLYNVKYKENEFNYNRNDILKLIKEFYISQINLKEAIELSFEYTRKLPEHLPELIYNIRQSLIFDIDDEQYGFKRQTILFSVILEGLNNNKAFFLKVFFELSKTFLQFRYHHTHGGRNNTISFYHYPIPLNSQTKNIRKTIWENIDIHYSDNAFEILKEYSSYRGNIVKEIMEFDMQYLLNIIDKHLTPKSFVHCKYVQEQIYWCRRNEVDNSSFNIVKSRFRNHLYEMYLIVNWDKFRDKESFEYENYQEYEKLKEEEIRTNFVFKNEMEIKSFCEHFKCLYNSEEERDRWSYNNSLEIIIDENCKNNFLLGCKLISNIIDIGLENYIPRVVFYNHLVTEEKTDSLWSLLQSKIFRFKPAWELMFFDNIADSLVNEKYIPEIKNTIIKIDYNCHIFFDKLQRFLVFEPNLFENILEICVNKYNNGEKIYLRLDCFEKHFKQLGNNIELIKKAYLQQVEMQNHFDYKKNGLLNILLKDSCFLLEYVNLLYIKNEGRYYLDDDHELGIVWNVDNIESVLYKVFDLSSEKEHCCGMLKHFCNSFFWNLEYDKKEQARKFLINYCKDNYENIEKVNIVVDITRHSMREYFNDILLEYVFITQDTVLFSKIYWRGNGGIAHGDVIFGDIEASDWRNILSIVEKSDLGIKLFPIKNYINSQIDISLKIANSERKRKYLERW